MENKENMMSLLDAVTTDFTPEEILLSGLQGIIAGTISMRRQQLGMSQKELAKKLNVRQSLVSRWENAETNFTLETLVRIASALDLKMQPPIVPQTPQVYSVGNSNVYPHPAAFGSWASASYKPVPDYDAKEN
jgi:DNA-binding XRE family transcriptional regulator